MVIVDSNVFIDIWKGQGDSFSEVFRTERVCICGVIRSELLHGAYSEKNLNEISEKLNLITQVDIASSDWNDFGRFLYELRTNGLTVPFQDALIAYTAILYDASVLSKDKHFKLIQVVDPRLRLHDIP